jgi:Fe2+ transport system protein B
MLTGFGCSIPGIMACRTLGNERDAWDMWCYLMSCGAAADLLLLIPSFFRKTGRAQLWLIYWGHSVAIAWRLLRSTVLAGEMRRL